MKQDTSPLALRVAALALASMLASSPGSAAPQEATSPARCAWGADVNQGAGEKLAASVHRELLTLVRASAKERPARAAALASKRAVEAIEAWKRFRNPELVDLARACLDHDDWRVVHRGLHWARALGDPTLCERSWLLLDRPEPRLREKAAITCLETWSDETAARLAGGRAREVLFVVLAKESEFHVKQALRALQRRCDGELVPRRVADEVVVDGSDRLRWTPFLAGMSHLAEVAPGVTLQESGDPGLDGAGELPVATRFCAPLLGFGEEEVPNLVLQPFGKPRRQGTLSHTGQDVGGCFDGAGVYAIAAGVVRWVLCSGTDMGTLIVVEHHVDPAATPELEGRPLVTSLAMHCGATVFVSAGEQVEAGQLLGTIGLSYSIENGGQFAHLHFGLYPGPFRPNHNYGYKPADQGLDDWLDPSVVLPRWIAGAAHVEPPAKR